MLSLKENFNVLIINHDPSKSNKLTGYLKVHGYNIIISPSINKALEIISNVNIDTIIFESLDPTMDGFSKLKRFREQIKEKKIKYLSMSEKKAG